MLNPPINGKYKIASMVCINAPQYSTMCSGSIANTSKSLSDSYLKTSQEVYDNKYKTLKDVYEGLKFNNNESLKKIGEDKSNWKGWNNVIKKYIASLHRDGKLTSLLDHADLFKEIADGLNHVYEL